MWRARSSRSRSSSVRDDDDECNPGKRLQFKRVYGPYKLPYDNLPCLLLAWISTEAVRTQSRELVLEASLSEFMRELGICSTSGEKYTRLRNQMNRLFHCQAKLVYADEQEKRFIASCVADRGEFW